MCRVGAGHERTGGPHPAGHARGTSRPGMVPGVSPCKLEVIGGRGNLLREGREVFEGTQKADSITENEGGNISCSKTALHASEVVR